ncbi:uroporphyrin-III C-methyltransferase [Melioribacter roseus P3M-2]|uniref:Uroporphyrin-III C-methyltransferase n=1 Tax=Melioribacter roseus (strain DSM 23840 / JCM 17771 / VKM B-2668 / P3M-2) TaxID=1191523 RepID=I7A2F6_MELRP|nr:uroporphyrinogen-III C-methyltransferase [Melioribacter roseus]AFN74106.1 uroporphyrin-III C-methyltransferase [Melioribacter roseus P3M-2]
MYKIKSLPVLLRNPKILVIGGGNVAGQKISVLLQNNVDFVAIAEHFREELQNLEFKRLTKSFEKKDAEGFDIIIDATGNPEVNRQLKELKKERFFLLNTVDVPQECDFYFSSLLLYNNLKIAISSDGASPTLTQVVRDRIKNYLPAKLEELAEKKLNERSSGIVDVESTRSETERLFGKVFIVGCGVGGVEFLTVKAYHILKEGIDAAVYDNLVSDEILSILPGRVEKIYAGKSKGSHSMTQEEINTLLVKLASEGKRVGRLKNGDPYIFGRGSEEALHLINNKIDVEIIPGISSATAAPLLAGIPPTSRNFSSSVSIVTGHLKGGEFDYSWIDLLKRKNHTTVVLMGVTYADKISELARKQKVDDFTPAAVISNAGRRDQKVEIGALSDLEELAARAVQPSLIVFGDVVNLSRILPRYTVNEFINQQV